MADFSGLSGRPDPRERTARFVSRRTAGPRGTSDINDSTSVRDSRPLAHELAHVVQPSAIAARIAEDCGSQPLPDLTVAYGRLEPLWIKDMFTALQILRANDRRAYQLLVDNSSSAAPRTRLVLTAISAPENIAPSDFTGIPADQAREVRAFTDLRSWADAATGLPRKGKPGAGVLSDSQRDMVDYIARRRFAATAAPGTVADKNDRGLMYAGRPRADPTPHGGADPLQAAIWSELDLEGSASSVNTYDDQKFTWGKGWSAQSTLPRVLTAFFAADDRARVELMEAGFTYHAAEHKWLYVSTANGYVLEGNEALDAFRKDRKFVGLLVHVAEDPVHQQNMVNAQADVLATGGRAGDVPAAIRAQVVLPDQAATGSDRQWTMEAIRFGAHCVHWGRTWGEVQAHGPSLHSLLRWIADIKGHQDAHGATLVEKGPSQTIRHFANHAAQSLMGGPAALPNPTVPGTYYFHVDGDANSWWTWRP